MESKEEDDSMDLPVNFPSEAEVIVRECARFRALSSQERLQSIRGVLAAGALMMRQSPRAAFLRTYTREQEDLARLQVKEFIARHAG
jgi:hypothetical protein